MLAIGRPRMFCVLVFAQEQEEENIKTAILAVVANRRVEINLSH
jgi:hypothetical protein